MCVCVRACVLVNSKKKIFFFFFFEVGNFFSNWEKNHLNPIGKGAEFRPLRTPKKSLTRYVFVEKKKIIT